MLPHLPFPPKRSPKLIHLLKMNNNKLLKNSPRMLTKTSKSSLKKLNKLKRTLLLKILTSKRRNPRKTKRSKRFQRRMKNLKLLSPEPGRSAMPPEVEEFPHLSGGSVPERSSRDAFSATEVLELSCTVPSRSSPRREPTASTKHNSLNFSRL